MRQVATACGVAVSTVSKALRHDPSIPEARCREIASVAGRLGYRPNPMVAALMAQLHHGRRRSDPHHLAWLDLWPASGGDDVAMNREPILTGARARAFQLGYGIEVYAVAIEGISMGRLRRMLVARGQWGVIIPPVPESAMRLPLELRGLAAVTIGSSLLEPIMHRVSPNHFQGCTLAWDRLRSSGFRRVGLILSLAMSHRVGGRWLGAFLACQRGAPARDRVAPLLVDRADGPALDGWLRRERPDAVLVAEDPGWGRVGRRRRPPLAWLLQQGPPRDLGGLDHRPEELGRVAVDVVVAQIHRNDRGSPPIPQTVLVDAVWTDASACLREPH